MINAILEWDAAEGGSGNSKILNDLYVHILGSQDIDDRYKAGVFRDLVARWKWPAHSIEMSIIVNHYEYHDINRLSTVPEYVEETTFVSLATKSPSCLLVIAQYWPGDWAQAKAFDGLRDQVRSEALRESRLRWDDYKEIGRPFDPVVMKALRKIFAIDV